MEKEKRYYAYRANIAFEDITIFNYQEEDNKENRNKLFRGFFEQLKKDKLKSDYARREYSLLHVTDQDDIFVCHLARKRDVSLNKIEEYKIIKKTEDDYPYVKVFVDLKHQKILIECNTAIFSNYETCKKTIEHIIKHNIKDKNATITLNPICKQNEFKEHISSAEYIYSIKFKLESPNFLDSKNAAKDFVGKFHEDNSSDSLELTIKNKSGKLNLDTVGIESFVEYAECGAGTWELKYKNKGSKQETIKSGKLGQYIYILDQDTMINNALTHKQLSILKKAFEQVEVIESFKELK